MYYTCNNRKKSIYLPTTFVNWIKTEEEKMDRIQESPFELLRNKSILAILDGDTEFGELDEVKISMPYLTGPVIVEISQFFGLPATYSWSGGGLSRSAYLDNLIVHGIKTNRINDVLMYLFSMRQFEKKLEGIPQDRIQVIYGHIVQTTIEQINGILFFARKKLVLSKRGFSIVPNDPNVEVTTPEVKNIDREYIKDISERAMNDVVNGDYDSAITKSRTIVEEVFCYVIEKKNETPTTSGDIGRLYKQVKDLYSMHPDKNLDRQYNTLLSGLEKIVSSIAELRNQYSDSHGVGSKRISISEHHARFLVNSAITMAEFILAVSNE